MNIEVCPTRMDSSTPSVPKFASAGAFCTKLAADLSEKNEGHSVKKSGLNSNLVLQ